MVPEQSDGDPKLGSLARARTLDDLLLDPGNPRLEESDQNLPQDQLMQIMVGRFNIEEVAESILASGYRPLDPLLGYRNTAGKVVIREGNRRVTALKLLLNPSLAPEKDRAEWVERASRVSPALRKVIEEIDVTIAEAGDALAVDAYVGYRHVNGIMPWPAQEKAKFIAHLVDVHDLSYAQVANRLGSYPRHVEKLYVAYQVFRQAKEDGLEGFENIKYGTLVRVLQAGGVREFLGFDYPDDPKKSRRPVPSAFESKFEEFVRWTFGTDDDPAVLKDSREATKLGVVLQSGEALRYLRSAERPSLERAWLKSGGQKESLVELLYAAADRLEESAALTPQYRTEEDPSVLEALDRCALYAAQILRDYPAVRDRHFQSP